MGNTNVRDLLKEQAVYKQKFAFIDNYLNLLRQSKIKEFLLLKSTIFEKLNRIKEFPFQYPPAVYYEPVKEKDRVPQNLLKITEPAKPVILCIYFPFCKNRCSYCQFFSYKNGDEKMFEDYLVHFKKELLMYKDVLARNKIQHIYIEGGTPTLMTDKQFEALLAFIEEHFVPLLDKPKDQIEYTCQASPYISEKKLEIMKKYGVDSISLGVQTLNNKILKNINRFQTGEDVLKILPRLISDFKVTVDLIAGLPGSTPDTVKYDLETLIKLKPQHFCMFNVTVYDHSDLGKSGYYLNYQKWGEFYDLGYKILMDSGYKQVTFDEYALDDQSKPAYLEDYIHDTLLWGTGTSAFCYTGDYWYTNVEDFEAYKNFIDQGKIPMETIYKISPEQKMIKYIIYELRSNKLDKKRYQQKFGQPVENIIKLELDALELLGLIEQDDTEIRLTYEGKKYFDIGMQFLMRK